MTDHADREKTVSERFAERAERSNVLLSATVERFGGGAATSHRVRDLSTRGMRVDRADGLARGATVLVTVGDLAAVGATVVWSEDGHAGLRFAEPVDPGRARARTAIRSLRDETAPGAPSSGWLPTLSSPYRRR